VVYLTPRARVNEKPMALRAGDPPTEAVGAVRQAVDRAFHKGTGMSPIQYRRRQRAARVA
jgi:hypothetical protein